MPALGQHPRSDSVTVLTPATDEQKDSPPTRLRGIVSKLRTKRNEARGLLKQRSHPVCYRLKLSRRFAVLC